MTEVQEVVVKSRLENGYVLLGTTISIVNGLDCKVLSKKSHTIVINSLGYDEYLKGLILKLKGSHE